MIGNSAIFTQRTSQFYSTESPNLKEALRALGDTKVTDGAQTREHVKVISRGLLARYRERYFVRGGGSFLPVFHIMLGIGILGYSWEYSHLSNNVFPLYKQVH